MQLDAWFSMVVFTVATVAFYLLGAAVLHPQGLDPKGPEMIPTLSRMYLQPLAGHAPGGLPGLDAGRLPARGLGRPVQDALRRHRGQQPPDRRLPRPDRHLAPARAASTRADGPGLLRLSIRCLALGLYYAYREPQALIKVGGIAQGADAPPDRRGHPLPPAARHRPPRRPDLPLRHPDLARLLRDHGVASYSIYDLFRKLVMPSGG